MKITNAAANSNAICMPFLLEAAQRAICSPVRDNILDYIEFILKKLKKAGCYIQKYLYDSNIFMYSEKSVCCYYEACCQPVLTAYA